MLKGKAHAPASVEELVAATRRAADEILAQHHVPLETASRFVREALLEVHCPRGLVIGASGRWLRILEEGCRRLSARLYAVGKSLDYGPVLDAAVSWFTDHRERMTRERRSAGALMERLSFQNSDVEVPVPHLEDDPRHRTLGNVEALLDAVRAGWSFDPHASLRQVRKARRLLARLDPANYGRARLADFEARAWAYEGSVCRILGRVNRAAEAYQRADEAMARGSLDPREQADINELKASLLRMQDRFGEARRLLEQAVAIHRWMGDLHLEGRCLLSVALILSYTGDPEGAIPMARRALQQIDTQREPRLQWVAYQNLACDLVYVGRVEEVVVLLPKIKRLVKRFGGPGDQLRARWLEAQTALETGDAGRGQRILIEVRDQYVEQGQGYDVALVSVDLVARYLGQGRAAEARQLAQESVPILQATGAQQFAVAAIVLLCQALELESATEAWVRDLQTTLRKRQFAPPTQPETPS
ncbi:MAG: tetratricopeptide repeat protein [Acidobacteriota bacterium]